MTLIKTTFHLISRLIKFYRLNSISFRSNKWHFFVHNKLMTIVYNC